MIFSIKLLCGTIVDITLSDNFYDLSLIDIKTKVFEALSEELSKNITPKHIHLFSFNDDSNLYKDMINGITIGCYIDQFIVEIDFDDNNEYFLENNYENPYERIVFKIITNVVLSEVFVYNYIGNNMYFNDKFLDVNDYVVTSRTGRNLNYVIIESLDSTYKSYKSIEEFFMTKNSSMLLYEDICTTAQKEYENFRTGIVESYTEEELWEELKDKNKNI